MVITYKWFFGDGTTGSGESPTHTYGMPGIYTVTLETYEDGVLAQTVVKTLHITVETWNEQHGFDVTNTNACYRFGVSAQEGIGVSEVTGDSWVLPPGRVEPLRITDRNGVVRTVSFDNNDRRMYELSSVRGVESLGFEPVWRDKAPINGVGGEEYSGYIRFAGNIGTLERYFLEIISCNVYTRPIQPELRGDVSYDTNGYPLSLVMQVSIGTEDNVPPVAQAKKIKLPKHEIVFDRRVEGHQLQTTVQYSVAPVLINGITENIIAKDKLEAQNLEVLHEEATQMVISQMLSWYSRGIKLLLNRMTGIEDQYGLSVTPIVGADGFGGSGIEVTASTMYLSGRGNFGRAVFWYRDDTPVGNMPRLIVYATLGNWVLAKADVDSTGFTFGVGKYFDMRMYPQNAVTDDVMEYIYNDVVDNNGNNIMPIWG